MKLYVSDYLKDTRHLSLAAKGAWTDLLFFMWPKGTYERTREQLCREIGVAKESLDSILEEVATVGTVTERNGTITVMSRRLSKEERDRENNAFRQVIHRRNGKITEQSRKNNSLDVRSQMSDVRSYKQQRHVFTKPTVDEILSYASSLGFALDAHHFFDYYEARGWKFKTGQPVKDWRACVRTWKKGSASKPEKEKSVGLDFN